MECREVRALADAYLDDELLVETNHGVLAHLGQCPDCRAELQRRQTLRTTIRRAFDRDSNLAPREQFATALEGRLRHEFTAPDSLKLLVRWPWLAAAAVLVAAALSVWLWTRGARWAADSPQTTGISPVLLRLAEPAAADHRDCALRHQLSEMPIDLEQSAKFDRAFPGLDRAARVPAGSLPGSLKQLAAHVCLWKGHRFGHVVFSYDEQLVSLLVTNHGGDASGSAASPPAECPRTDGFTIACFAAPQHAVFVVSSLPSADTMSVAKALNPSIRDHLTRATAILRQRLREPSWPHRPLMAAIR